MKNYCGWINTVDFAGEEYQKLYCDLENYQFDFLKKDKKYQDGWIYLDGQRMFGSDVISNWSRQFEYPYVLGNILSEGKESKILDVGSGYSFFPFYLRDLGYNMTCSDLLDLHDLFYDTGVKLIKDDITQSKIENKFDIIYSLSVFEHIPDKKAAIEKLYNLLKPGGKLILTMDCNLDLRVGSSTPNYGELCRIINYLEEKFTPITPYNLRRDKNLVTTKMFSTSYDKWRLPWKEIERSRFRTIIKNIFGFNQVKEVPAISVFTGVWQKKIM